MTAAKRTWLLSGIKDLHGAVVFRRRARVLAELMAARIPRRASLLDVGCGDGTIGNLIAQIRPDVSVRGVELMVRSGCKIQCEPFDGSTLPFADGSFDVCILADVLHHTTDVSTLLCEAARVSRSRVLIKDHLNENTLDDVTLRFMDWVGNRPHGVSNTYNYQSRVQWAGHFAKCGLVETDWTTQVPLYPWPVSLLLGRRLHFMAALSKRQAGSV
jgi:ubiquinone/menaquinone biosynthesis C-methylase UbiE